jgi:hypothetical protein
MAMANESHGRPQRVSLDLSTSAEYLLEECRMVLPGIQALFGFQLMVVFQQAFAERLSPGEQHLHLLAIALVAIAVALVMTPAAYHRAAGAREVTDAFIRTSTRLLLASMVPLAVGLSVEFYLIARLLLGAAAMALAIALFVLVAGLWFALPRFLTPRRGGR